MTIADWNDSRSHLSTHGFCKNYLRRLKGSSLPRQVKGSTCGAFSNAAVKHKGSLFEILYHRYVPRMGHNQTIGVIAHKPCRLIWKILHQGARYEERGPAISKTSKQKRTQKMIRELRRLGYRVELTTSPSLIPV